MNTFEMNLDELQAIVDKLENEDLPLEKVFELYQKGMQLAESMNKQISDYSGKITALEKEKGLFVENDFSPETVSDD